MPTRINEVLPPLPFNREQEIELEARGVQSYPIAGYAPSKFYNPRRIAGTVPESAGNVGPNYNERVEMLDEMNRYKTFRGFDTERWNADRDADRQIPTPKETGVESQLVNPMEKETVQRRVEFAGKTVAEAERVGTGIAQENRQIMEDMAAANRGERVEVVQARMQEQAKAEAEQGKAEAGKPEPPFVPRLGLFKETLEEPETLAITNPEAYKAQVEAFSGQLAQMGTVPKTAEEFEDMLKTISGSSAPGNMGALREAGEKYLREARPRLYRQLAVSNIEGTANDISRVAYFDAKYPDMAKGMGYEEKLAQYAANPQLEANWREDPAHPVFNYDPRTGGLEETFLPTVETVKSRNELRNAKAPGELGAITTETVRPYKLPARVTNGIANFNQIRSFHNTMAMAEAADVPVPELGAMKLNNKIREGTTARISELAAGGLSPEEAIKQVIQEAKDEGKLDTNNTEKYSEYGASVAMAARDVYTAIGESAVKEAQAAMRNVEARGTAELAKRTPLIAAEAGTAEYIQKQLEGHNQELRDKISRYEVGARIPGVRGARYKAALLQLQQQTGVPNELPRNLTVENLLADYILPNMSREYAGDPAMEAFIDEQIVNLKANPSGVNQSVWDLGQMVAGEWTKGIKNIYKERQKVEAENEAKGLITKWDEKGKPVTFTDAKPAGLYDNLATFGKEALAEHEKDKITNMLGNEKRRKYLESREDKIVALMDKDEEKFNAGKLDAKELVRRNTRNIPLLNKIRSELDRIDNAEGLGIGAMEQAAGQPQRTVSEAAPVLTQEETAKTLPQRIVTPDGRVMVRQVPATPATVAPTVSSPAPTTPPKVAEATPTPEESEKQLAISREETRKSEIQRQIIERGKKAFIEQERIATGQKDREEKAQKLRMDKYHKFTAGVPKDNKAAFRPDDPLAWAVRSDLRGKGLISDFTPVEKMEKYLIDNGYTPDQARDLINASYYFMKQKAQKTKK